jgi:hypothetical protein
MPTATRTKLSDEEVIKSFAAYQGPGATGYVIDFLGAKTRTSYISDLSTHGGVVEGYPIPTNFHATATEWAGVLRAVLEAEKEIVAVELGAGWAPWLVTVARAAHERGIERVRLVGVEGCKAHCSYMATHFTDNGLNPEDHALLHGAVGVSDSVAAFPVSADPSAVYGARAIFSGEADATVNRRIDLRSFIPILGRKILRVVRGGINSVAHDMNRCQTGESKNLNSLASHPNSSTLPVKCFSLATLLKPFTKVDLVHVDIQGDESIVIRSALDVLKQKVIRLVIGTHSRAIEQELLDELAWQSWDLESQETCLFLQEDRRMHLRLDGCQVWRNRAYDHHAKEENGVLGS